MSTVWLADLTHTGTGKKPASDTTPIAIGFLAAYARSIYPELHYRLFRYPRDLAQALENSGPPDVLAFTSYVWNHRLSMAFARHVKQQHPRTLIVCGGPNFPLHDTDQRAFLAEYPQIDIFIEREGEVAFADLLSRVFEHGAAKDDLAGAVPSSHMLRQGELISGMAASRLRDLTVIPSPYLTGLLDPFLDGYLVPTIQTNRGCPFSCSFCLEGEKYYSKVAAFGLERTTAELDYLAAAMEDVVRRGGRNELMITDSNFGMFNDDSGVCDRIGALRGTGGWPERVNVTTGKNRREKVLDAVSRAGGAIQLSGAVQSLDEDVLKNVRRANIRTNDLIAIAQAANGSATRVYSDVILGLPGDSRAAHEQTLRSLVDSGMQRINTFQFALLNGASINTPQTREEFGLRSSFRIVPRGFGVYPIGSAQVPVAEVDEVVVGSDTMDFEDYLLSREYDLSLFLFHNDDVFLVTKMALQACGIALSAWLDAVHDVAYWPEPLRELRGRYRDDTAGQLFDTADAVEREFAERSADYLSGQAGNNLLYSYRAIAIVRHMRDLGVVARHAAARLASTLPEPGPAQSLLEDAIELDVLCLDGVMSETSPAEPLIGHFRFDLPTLAQAPGTPIADLAGDTVLALRTSAEAASTIASYKAHLGASDDAIGRALSRVVVADLRRTVVKSG
jgi:tRNA A37 methylthiotransferase MiaB